MDNLHLSDEDGYLIRASNSCILLRSREMGNRFLYKNWLFWKIQFKLAFMNTRYFFGMMVRYLPIWILLTNYEVFIKALLSKID